jgi:hypothetical protein
VQGAVCTFDGLFERLSREGRCEVRRVARQHNQPEPSVPCITRNFMLEKLWFESLLSIKLQHIFFNITYKN